MFMTKQNTEEVIEFVKDFIARLSLHRTMRTDPATISIGRISKNFLGKDS